MNALSGAPDPTAGASQTDVSVWCLDECLLKENIHKTLLKFIVPTPNVVSDIECLEHASSATAAEYTSLLRPLRGREPEAMWNLVSIVREMFKRNDKNSIPLLKLLTNKCLEIDQIMQLWFLVKTSQSNSDKALFNNVSMVASSQRGANYNGLSVNHTPPVHQACASLMDEIVTLWRIACLNPEIGDEKHMYREQLIEWHHETLEKLRKFCNSIINNNSNIWLPQQQQNNKSNVTNGEKLLKRLDMDLFSGFKPVISACLINWDEFDFNTPVQFRQECLKHIAVDLQPIEESKKPDFKISTANKETGDEPLKSREPDQLTSLYTFEYDPSKLRQLELNKKETKAVKINFNLLDETRLEVLFARCEALHSHGFTEQACILAELLATHILETTEIPSLFKATVESSNGVKPKFIDNYFNSFLWRSFLLCNVLNECAVQLGQQELKAKRSALSHLAFRIGLFGLETPRPPAASKALEVKLLNQEQELVNLLKKMSIGSSELALLQEKATIIKERGPDYNKTQRLGNPSTYQSLPILLASFIFETFLNWDSKQVIVATNNIKSLGFEAACAALSMKANVSESAHSILCEGIRRQKGDLAMNLLLTYKDDETSLLKILDKLLDRDVYMLFKSDSTVKLNPFNPNLKRIQQQQQQLQSVGQTSEESAQVVVPLEPQSVPTADVSEKKWGDKIKQGFSSSAMADSLSSGWEESENESPNLRNDLSLLETKYRCLSLVSSKPVGDHQNPLEPGTSSESSPSTKRKAFTSTPSNVRALEDSGDESAASSSSGHGRVNEQQNSAAAYIEQKTVKNPGRQLNQPSEALAHFMFEFSKSVLSKAGGTITTSVFLNHPSHQGGAGGPHRNLHICSFLISLYALGLHNCVQPTWLMRTYSSHVTWVNSQAVDIGYAAICILIECWQERLTPSECVSLADRVSRGRDNMTVKAAAELALAGLKHANQMNLTEIQRALMQCKEQSNDMLQRACVIVEGSVRDANSSNLLEILFTIAKRWDELHGESLNSSIEGLPPLVANMLVQQSPHSYPMVNMINPNQPYFNQQAQQATSSIFGQSFMNSANSNMSYNSFMNNYANNSNNANSNGNFYTPDNYHFNAAAANYQQYQQTHHPQQMNFLQNNMRTQPMAPYHMPASQLLPQVDENVNNAAMMHLTSAFRVGMLGLEALPKRVDGSHQVKYRQIPSYSDDVKWLWKVAIKLG